MLRDLLQQRRSIRSFTDAPVSKEAIDILLQCALLSPSSRSIRPWEFIVVDEPELIRKLSRAKEHGSAFMAGAPAAIVVAGLPEVSDVWIEDSAIAASNLLLAAEDLGLGACWIQIRLRTSADGGSSEEYVRETLNIPASRSVEAVIALGHPNQRMSQCSLDNLEWQKVSYNRRP